MGINKTTRSESSFSAGDDLLFRLMFESHPAIMLLIDPETGLILEANPAAVQFYGYAKSILCGMLITEINCLSAREVAFERQKAKKEGRNYLLVKQRLASGQERIVEESSSNFIIKHKNLLFSIINDITERTQLEGTLLSQQKSQAAELVIANQELVFQNKEKEKRTAELVIANQELVFQNEEKEKRAAELVVANQELVFQNEEKAKRAAELVIANQELAFQNAEKAKRAVELIIAKELVFHNVAKAKRAAELIIANNELIFQNEEKAKRAAELIIANNELVFHNEEKAKRAAELIIATKELIFQNEEKAKRAAELLISNAYLENLINYANAPIIVWDPDFRITRFNHAFEFLTGRSEAEVIGQPLEILFPPSFTENSMEQIRATLIGERWKSVEIKIQNRDGSVRTVLWNSATLFSEDGKTPIATIAQGNDITERKRIEQELARTSHQFEETANLAKGYATQAEMANIAKREFLANMSHEIRTPMNGVIGMTGLLLDTDLNEEQRYYAEMVRSSGEGLLTLINDILDFSKIEAGKMELETLDFDLNILLDDFSASLAVRTNEKGLELIYGVGSDVPLLLQGDPGRLRQILTNLVSNAIKFTNQGQVVVRVSCPSQSKTGSGMGSNEIKLHFSIQDTGIGIPVKMVNQLFNKFQQVDASTTRKYGGTGLGLAISKQLVELMGGEIGVSSEVGTGTEFWFTIRLVLQPGVPGERRDETRQLKVLSGVRILVVDDNATNREILVARLAAWGLRAAEALDGEAALAVLTGAQEEGDPFRIALIDMQMPGLNGVMLGEQIKKNKSLAAIQLVLLSVLGERRATQRSEENNFAGYLKKPVNNTELLNILLCALGVRDGRSPSGSPGAKIQGVNLNGKVRILVVEDNITNQQVVMGILKRYGIRTDASGSGFEALVALETIPYDLVLMDVQMPDMDGLEATRQIRKPGSAVLDHQIPIIALTAHTSTKDREQCLQAGMNDYATKPVNPQALLEVLMRWLPEEIRQGSVDSTIQPALLPSAKSLNEYPVFDKVGMLERLMYDEGLVRVVIKSFLEDIPRQILALKGYLETGDVSGAERQAHTIKGATSNIGGEALRQVAAEMEKNGRQSNLPAIRADLGELELQFERLRAVLQKEVE